MRPLDGVGGRVKVHVKVRVMGTVVRDSHSGEIKVRKFTSSNQTCSCSECQAPRATDLYKMGVLHR